MSPRGLQTLVRHKPFNKNTDIKARKDKQYIHKNAQLHNFSVQQLSTCSKLVQKAYGCWYKGHPIEAGMKDILQYRCWYKEHQINAGIKDIL